MKCTRSFCDRNAVTGGKCCNYHTLYENICEVRTCLKATSSNNMYCVQHFNIRNLLPVFFGYKTFLKLISVLHSNLELINEREAL